MHKHIPANPCLPGAGVVMDDDAADFGVVFDFSEPMSIAPSRECGTQETRQTAAAATANKPWVPYSAETRRISEQQKLIEALRRDFEYGDPVYHMVRAIEEIMVGRFLAQRAQDNAA